jgi:hypothetical protein
VRLLPLTFAVLLLSTGSAATAATCYVIYDRNDAVVYRDYKAPFDLSDTDSPEREKLRKQGLHLLVAEFGDECNPVGFISPTTGANTSSVDEIVNGVRPAISSTIAASGATQSAPRPGAKPASQPRKN